MKNEKCLYALMYNGKVAVYAEESKDDSVKLYRLTSNHEFKFICTLTNNDNDLGSIINTLLMISGDPVKWAVRDEYNSIIGYVSFSRQNKVVELSFDTLALGQRPENIIRYDSIIQLENYEEIKKEDVLEVISPGVCKFLYTRHGNPVGYEMIDDSNGITICFSNGRKIFSAHIKVVPTIVDGRRLVGYETSKYGNKLSTRVVVDRGGHEWLQVVEYPRFKGDWGYVIFYDIDKIGDKNVNMLELSTSEKSRIASSAISFQYEEIETQYAEGVFNLYDEERYAGKIYITKDSIHLKCSGLKREGMDAEKLDIEINKNEISDEMVRKLTGVMKKEITEYSFETHDPNVILGQDTYYVMHISLIWKNELLHIRIEEPFNKKYTIDISRVERKDSIKNK